MSLPVPLSVRVGDRHITREVKSLSFRREAVGGVRSISFGLARPLSNLTGLEPLSQVYVYDTRSAATVAQGRFADTGRTAATDGGQSWDVVAFGPAQHASDVTLPLIYVDRDLTAWDQVATSSANATAASGSKPDGTQGVPGILTNFAEGAVLDSATSRVAARYRRTFLTGQKIGGFGYNWAAGVTSASWTHDSIVSTDGNYAACEILGKPFDTAGGTVAANVGTNFSVGRNELDISQAWTDATTVASGDVGWGWAQDIWVRATVYTQDGAEYTGAGYSTNSFVNVSDVVRDLLGRPGVLPEYDGTNATVATTTFEITQLAYPDGVTPAQVFEDLMGMEPAHRWTTTPDSTGNGYGFRWELWPTTVRYEATLDDGGTFPLSSQNLYNRVIVRWVDEVGRTRTTPRSLACAILDDEGLVRQAVIDLGSDLGTQANANQAGDAFLAEHNVPKNSGTLAVARPIRDVITGAMVDPWEIEPGELVRILGVEAYPDAFNASTNDGQGVFRIFAVDYTSEGNVATLALDSDPRETADALVKLLKQRSRR